MTSCYEAGDGSYEAIAENFGVGICSVRRWVALLRATGSVQKRSAPGAASRISESQLAELVKIVEEKPDRTLKELCATWQERFGVAISKSAMERTLSRANLTLKKRRFGLKNVRAKMLSKSERNF